MLGQRLQNLVLVFQTVEGICLPILDGWKADGSYKIIHTDSLEKFTNTNWYFLTGDKILLYKLARQGYIIDNDKPDSTQHIGDQFLHSQFFALVDKNNRVRGIYDGLENREIEKLIGDIKNLLKEKVTTKRFMDGFGNNPG